MLLQKEIDAVSWIKIRDSLLNAGSGIIAFLSSIIILSKYRKEEAIGFACGLELVSLICLVRSYILYASADQKVVEIPRERLLFIQKKCVEIFSQPFVTDVKIIKL